MFHELDMQVINSCLSRKTKSSEQTEQEKTKDKGEKTVPLPPFADGEYQWKENFTGLLLVLSVYWENYCSLYILLGGYPLRQARSG